MDAAAAAFGRIPTLSMVHGRDDRRPVSNVKLMPWRAICALRITSADGASHVGTGWFIGRRTVITAGHCVYMPDAGGWVKSIEVIPALEGTDEPPFGEAVGTRFRAADGWVHDREESCDYGAILLEEDLGAQTGTFEFAAMSDAELRGQPVNIAGYPVDLDAATKLYFDARVVSTLGATRLFYDVDTFGGQSGAAIWVNLENEGPIAVGIHTTGGELTNSGTRITTEVRDNLVRWRAEGDAASPRP